MRENASTQVGFDGAVVASIAAALRACMLQKQRLWLIGVSGLQGSGKSTFARQLARANEAIGIATQVLSLDDFYFGRRARMALGRDVHPLLATRGVPGTHDIDLLRDTLAKLRKANPQHPARVPRFDKGRDTRMPPSRWRQVIRKPDCIVLEGWCIGVPAQARAAVARPVNALERTEDVDGTWRESVNDQLIHTYASVRREIDALIVLQAPRFDVVVDWRDQQERALRRRGAVRAMDEEALRRFVQFHERLSRHALRILPARADWLLKLDRERRVVRVVEGKMPRR